MKKRLRVFYLCECSHEEVLRFLQEIMNKGCVAAKGSPFPDAAENHIHVIFPLFNVAETKNF